MATMINMLVYIPDTSYQEVGVQHSYDVQHSRRFLWLSDHAVLRCLVTFFIYMTVVAVRYSLYMICLWLAESEPSSAKVFSY